MSKGQIPLLSNSGVIKFFSKDRRYGFVEFDTGEPDLFFSCTTLYMANTLDIGAGVRVVFTRGVTKEGGPRVERFLEIGGVPADHGTYSFAVDGSFRFYSSITGTTERGVVRTFEKERGFGFITVDNGGGSLFFFIVELMRANRDDIEPGARVMFVRGRAKDGRPKVARFVEIDGVPVTAGDYRLDKGRFVFYRDGKPPPAESQEVAVPRKVEVTEPKPEPKPAPVQQEAPVAKSALVTSDEWLSVTLCKLKKGQIAYADSELFGEVVVPQPVLKRAKITSVQSHERFEVRCKVGGAKPVALAIRRY